MIKELMFSKESIETMKVNLPLIFLTMVAVFTVQYLIDGKGIDFLRVFYFAFFSFFMVYILFWLYALLALGVRKLP